MEHLVIVTLESPMYEAASTRLVEKHGTHLTCLRDRRKPWEQASEPMLYHGHSTYQLAPNEISYVSKARLSMRMLNIFVDMKIANILNIQDLVL